MNILQKEGFLMTDNPDLGACFEARSSMIKAHQSELLAEAAAERQAHAGAPLAGSRAGLRRMLGLFLVRIGRGLAGEAPNSQARSA